MKQKNARKQMTGNPFLWLLAGLAAMILAAGCAPTPRGDGPLTSFEKELDALGPPAEPLPEEVAAALMPAEPRVEGIAEGAAEPRFDVAVENVPAREFFMGLVEGTPYNMVVHPSVTGTVSLDLKAVTIPEVMEIMRDVYGFYSRCTHTGFQVLPGVMQTRVFYVNYLNLVRKGLSQTRVSSGQVSETSNSEDSDGSRSDRNRQAYDTMVSGSRIDTESKADFWTELNAALRTMIGQEEGRRIVVQPQAGVVVIRALPDELQEVERYLATIQGNLTRQVILEAKILEVVLGDGYQAGINWTAMIDDVTVAQSRGDIFADNGMANIIGSDGDAIFSNLASGAFGGVFSATMDFTDFQGFIELLETQGDVQVLSSPRIATVNNQKAVIKVGSDEFFVTDVSSDTVTGTTTTTSPDITLTPFFSGIALDVTPQINPRGQVTLHIHPTVSEVTDQTKDITVAGQTQSLPLAYSTVRESDSIVSAASGQVVVIGGLMKSQQQKRDAGVPLLGRLPAIGSLFRQTQSIARKSELVILLRPLVVESGSWERALSDSRQRFRQLGADLDTEWRGGKFARPAR
ncbi:pilus (MSHA type) biogenesis protein MshL [Desulfosarcina widdelii]|uniref:Pilus (MSHA type) biogenesis protein MshL n=1 Tax=Desulfosarcina widdelii TaxID=947919 RepID=A0A5K7Z280_9BACT|nr:pilus (MSHA type) biogenesis protein MshL [Desulfosarcina widdelii]BBO74770.1 pilus (MSHA type) biogenesis protein MshL [Desulfosarcina widdelii]